MKWSQGQAVVTVLFTVIIGTLVTTGAMMTLVNTYEGVTNRELSQQALEAAESGIEQAMLRLLRNTSYTGETIVFDQVKQSVVSVTSSSTINILSVGTAGTVARRISVTAHYEGLSLVIDSWEEVP